MPPKKRGSQRRREFQFSDSEIENIQIFEDEDSKSDQNIVKQQKIDSNQKISNQSIQNFTEKKTKPINKRKIFETIQNKSSYVWRHCKRELTENQVYCNYCDTVYKWDLYSASKMNNHLKGSHPETVPKNLLGPGRRKNNRKLLRNKIQTVVKKEVTESRTVQEEKKQLPFDISWGPKKNGRSIVWQHFIHSENDKLAYCLHCPSFYNIREGSTSGLLKHLKINHPEKLPPEQNFENQKLRADRQLHENARKSYQKEEFKIEKLWNMHKNKDVGRLIYYLKTKGNPDPKQVKRFIYNQELSKHPFMITEELKLKFSYNKNLSMITMWMNYWGYQQDHKDLYRKLKKQNVFVGISEINDRFINVLLMTKQMRQSYQRYGDCVNFSYSPFINSQQKNNKIKGTIEMSGINEAGKLVIFGLIVVYLQEQNPLADTICKFLRHLKQPPQTIIFQPFNFLQFTLIRSLTRFNGSFNLINRGKLTVEALQNSQVSNKKSFIGNFFSNEVIKKIEEHKRYQKPLGQNLLIYFVREKNFRLTASCFKYMSQQAMNQLQILKPEHYFDTDLLFLKNNLDQFMFSKILYIFTFVDENLDLQIKDRVAIVKKKSSNEQTTIQYSKVNDYWKCKCGQIEFLGIPCIHLVKVLKYFHGCISYYVNSRWFRENENTNYSKLEANYTFLVGWPTGRRELQEKELNQKIWK